MVRRPEASMAGRIPRRPRPLGRWQVAQGLTQGVTPASLVVFSLSDTAGFSLRLPSHCHVLKTITFFPSFQPRLFAHLLYILLVVLVGESKDFFNPAIKSVI